MEKNNKTPRSRGWKKALKITAWTVMGLVLFVLALVMGVINILRPERLTPLVENVLTGSLQNANVSLQRAELTVVKSYPFVSVCLDDLVITSTVVRDLSEDDREYLPQYADTVLAIGKVEGGLNIVKLLNNKLDLSDVTITSPSANLVVIDEETTNFDIIPPSEDEEPLTWDDIPGITLRNFTIVDPGLIRYYDSGMDAEISVGFEKFAISGSHAPLYSINIDGDLDWPFATEILSLPDVKFGLNGTLEWTQTNPTHIVLRDFDFLFSIIHARINADIDFSNGLVFNALDLDLASLDVTQILTTLSGTFDFGLPLPEDVDTDAKIDTRFMLKQPWNVDSESLPYMSIDLKIPECHLKVPAEHLDFEKFSADINFDLAGDDINNAVVDIRNLYVAGPATDLTVKGKVTHLITDPLFDGTVDGRCDMSRFPPTIKNMFNGTLKGRLTAHVGFRGSPSMFNATDFHRLAVTGNMEIDNLFWLSADTVNMVEVDRVLFNFGTRERLSRPGATSADSLLRATLRVDSASIVHSELAIGLKDFGISLVSENRAMKGKHKSVLGMGGGMKLGVFNLTSMSDSAVVRIRDVKGYAFVRPYNGDIRTPQMRFNIDMGRFAAGNHTTRVLIRKAHADFDARRIAKGKRAQQFSHIADSVYRVHPNLPPDSVYAIALRIHNEHHSRYRRVHPDYIASDSIDVIDWGTAPMLQKLLNLWTFNGCLTSHRASLFTPYMPMRNRFRDININFNNDTIAVDDLEYKIGNSDFTVNGRVTNLRRALTSSGGKRPLRVNFDIVSDTIDINQLTEVIFAGAAYSASEQKKGGFTMNDMCEDEDVLERRIAMQTQNAPDTIMPLLIPVNVDAELGVHANNVRYSDLDLRDMQGRVLAYGGSLNVDNLAARSDVGNIALSALYNGLHPNQLRFGFGLKLNDFRIDRFLQILPAVDSLLPVMRDISGIINADLAATVDVDQHMDLVLPTLDAAIGIQGDSLVLIDTETFKSMSKWLFFKNKNRNLIDRMDVQMIVRNNQIEVFPFIFQIDRYKLGVQGWNDFAMNFKYHIAVLKSPIPFKFGINIQGNPDKFKIRMGGAKFGEKQVRHVDIVDTTRVNLMRQIQNVFRRGAEQGRMSRLRMSNISPAAGIDLSVDTLSHADSLMYIREGLIDAPDTIVPADKNAKNKKAKRNNTQKKLNNKTSKVNEAGIGMLVVAILAMTAGLRRRLRRNRKPTNE